MASQDTGIGDRLRSVRKRRGMTQKELADAAGLSKSLVGKLEQGEKTDIRVETALKLATALRVHTTAILAGNDREEPDEQTVSDWEQVRRALAGLDGQPDEEPTADGVLGAVAAIRPAVVLNQFSAIRPELPGLIRDAHALDTDDEQSRQAQFVALNMTAWILTQMRQWDTAMYTLDLAADAAVDKLDTAEAVKTRVWLLLRQGDLAAARDTAIRWADEIEPRRLTRATSRELSLWGAFLLNIANAAVRDNRPGEALDALKFARVAGDCIGREVMSDTSTTRLFGPVTATYNRAEVYAIDGKPDKTLAIDASIPADALPSTEITRLRHQLDVASALSQMRRYPEAIAVIQETRANAPEWLAQQRYARDILGRVVDRRRTLTPEMRELADAVRLPL